MHILYNVSTFGIHTNAGYTSTVFQTYSGHWGSKHPMKQSSPCSKCHVIFNNYKCVSRSRWRQEHLHIWTHYALDTSTRSLWGLRHIQGPLAGGNHCPSHLCLWWIASHSLTTKDCGNPQSPLCLLAYNVKRHSVSVTAFFHMCLMLFFTKGSLAASLRDRKWLSGPGVRCGQWRVCCRSEKVSLGGRKQGWVSAPSEVSSRMTPPLSQDRRLRSRWETRKHPVHPKIKGEVASQESPDKSHR